MSEDTLNLLKDQRDAMESYIDALQKRIDSAEDTERCRKPCLWCNGNTSTCGVSCGQLSKPQGNGGPVRIWIFKQPKQRFSLEDTRSICAPQLPPLLRNTSAVRR